jgi:hypothetical protein
MKWEEILDVYARSTNSVRIQAADVQVKNISGQIMCQSHTTLGQVLENSAGIIVNQYLRILGRSSEYLQTDIELFNSKLEDVLPPDKWIVATDAWGGLFAIENAGVLEDREELFYFAPDSLLWERFDLGYADFIVWSASDRIKEFYEEFMWQGFEEFISNIEADKGIHIYPYLWAKECSIQTANKAIISLDELVKVNMEFSEKFSG